MFISCSNNGEYKQPVRNIEPIDHVYVYLNGELLEKYDCVLRYFLSEDGVITIYFRDYKPCYSKAYSSSCQVIIEDNE